jgi:hypothetical protein
MTPLSAVPLNSWTWLLGTLACFALAYRSYASYRRTANELSKYLAWFGLNMGIGQAFLAVPSFLTLDIGTLRTLYLAGEVFVYMSAVAQAAIVWCLVLRSSVSLRALTIPTAVVGLVSWLYAIPNSTLHLSGNFITYRDPLASTVIIGLILLSLFLPVGFYFLRAAAQQNQLKGRLTSLSLGLVYIGVGISTGGVELLSGQVITRYSAPGDAVFFAVMLVVMLWPRRVKTPTTPPRFDSIASK